jgi:iron complex transport system substrate-binding protein
MNQGATEFMLAMGLAGSMAGTAYIDDAIWPQYEAEYNNIPVLASAYPTEAEIEAVNPDFIVASYSSAFRHVYTRSNGRVSGIFNGSLAGPCTGAGSEWGSSDWTTCRPQLNSNGIGTYIFEDACEDSSLRPTTVTEDTVYEEMQALGAIFNVDPAPLIANMRDDFNQAAGLVSSGMSGPLRTVWLDCVGRCCADAAQEQVFVGAGTGAPNMLMQEAGLTNVFAGVSGNWACVNVSDIAAANPDVFVVVDAAWDTAVSKIEWLYNDAAFCQMEALSAARLVSIPFSASTLSPRNGPAALDLAIAALHVRTGSTGPTGQSGVCSFSDEFLQAETASLRCAPQVSSVVYDDSASNYPSCPTPPASDEAGGATRVMLRGFSVLTLSLLASVF